MIKVKKDEAFTGVIPMRHKVPKLYPAKCPDCGAIFLLHTDTFGIEDPEGPCPNCNHCYPWINCKISTIKYKFIRAWRERRQ
jgi:predicted Zn finger-like uncharacterized protein